MTTATIMSAISATAVAPVAPASANGAGQPAVAGNEQPFGALMEVVAGVEQAVTGQAPVSVSVPVRLPVPVQLAGRLSLHEGLNKGGLSPELSAAMPDKAAMTIAPAPVEALDGQADAPTEAAPVAPPIVEGEVASAVVAGPVETVAAVAAPPQGAKKGEPVGKKDEAELSEPSRVDVAIMPPQVVPTAIVVAIQQPAVPSHPFVAIHAPEQPAPSASPDYGQTMPPETPSTDALPKSTASAITTEVGATDAETTKSTIATGQATVATADATPQSLDQGVAPSLSFAASLPSIPVRGGTHIYADALATGTVGKPVVSAEAGQMGQSMGVAIARGVDAGRDTLLVRLDPAEMGRIHVRLSFDHDGAVRVAMSADSAVALDMLRREAGDLGRALNDAGVRADSQSFRFDSSGNGSAQQRGSEGGQQQGRSFAGNGPRVPGSDNPAEPSSAYRAVRSAGGLDLTI